jgi:hypothetical protein
MAGVATVFLGFSWYANTDLTNGRYVLFMDEMITFDEVLAIYSAGSPGAWWHHVTDGGDNRYGRIFWMVEAFLAYLPYKFGGEPALIIGERMVCAALEVFAIVILAFSWVRVPLLRLVAVVIACWLPYTWYFATMPKPEPLQLVFLALFLALVRREGLSAPRKWALLGLAMGAKISVLPFVALLWGLVLLGDWLRLRDGVLALRDAAILQAWRASAFALGMVVAVPILVSDFSRYLRSTFLNRGHGADNDATGPLDWLRMVNDLFFYTDYAFIPALAAVIAALAIWLFPYGKRLREVVEVTRWERSPALLLLGGMALIGPILLTVTRVWPQYLVVGSILLIIGLIGVLEWILERGGRRGQAAAVLVVVAVLPHTALKMVPDAVANFRYLAHRTVADQYRRDHARYEWVVASIEADNLMRLGEKVEVHFDPNQFLPSVPQNVQYVRYWGTFRGWGKGYPYVISLVDSAYFPESTNIGSNEKTRREVQEGRRLYARHVAPRGEACETAPCYTLLREGHGVRMFLRQDHLHLLEGASAAAAP